MSKPSFYADNFSGSVTELILLNDAYIVAAETWFDGADRENLDLMRQLRASLNDRINDAYHPELSAAEIAAIATAN
jgi:hypothetical protein